MDRRGFQRTMMRKMRLRKAAVDDLREKKMINGLKLSTEDFQPAGSAASLWCRRHDEPRAISSALSHILQLATSGARSSMRPPPSTSWNSRSGAAPRRPSDALCTARISSSAMVPRSGLVARPRRMDCGGAPAAAR